MKRRQLMLVSLLLSSIISKAQISTNPTSISPSISALYTKNVGFGTNNPQAGLHMLTGLGRNSNASIILERSDMPNTNQKNKLTIGISSNSFPSPNTLPAGSCVFMLSNPYSISDMAFSTNQTTPQLILKQSGNIGIGTISPLTKLDVQYGAVRIGDVSTPTGYKLYVETGILTEKVKVAVKTNTQWADYVFDEKYKLKPLEEVEAFISVNKHLPGIFSAEQIVKDGGIDISQMLSKQMEKIEELTLYLIQIKKQVVVIQKENAELKNLLSSSNN